MSIITVFNQKGGVGKTTTALNLLAAIATRKQRPLAIDLDPQCHLTHIFGVHPKSADDSTYSFFVRQRPLDDIAQITKSGVILLPAHLELAKLDTLLGKGVNVVTRLRQALHAARCDARAGGDRLLPAAQRAVAERDLRGGPVARFRCPPTSCRSRARSRWSARSMRSSRCSSGVCRDATCSRDTTSGAG